MSKLVWLAIGAFAIGTQSFMIAGFLPKIAGAFDCSVGTAAYLMTIFSLSYAVSSPILSSLLAQAPRKGLLIAALGGFGVISLLALTASSLGAMMAIQAALAICAGLYMPTANAVAVMVAGPERRARAISIVTGGLTLAIALGAPIGIAVAALGDWRIAFVLVSALSLLGVAGLAFGLPRDLPRGASTLRERFAVAQRPGIPIALLMTIFWTMGVFVAYAHIATYLATFTGVTGLWVSAALVMFGIGSAIGNGVGGRAADRFGAVATLRMALIGLGTMLALLSVIALILPPGLPATIIVFAILAIWGGLGWAGYPAQATRLVGLAPDAAVIALSLNASALYIGMASGAALGSLVMARGGLPELGFVGALCEAVALAALLIAVRSQEKVAPLLPQAAPQPAE
ncbi:MFS transporter [Terrarubrum flagellatum]|uniref:MFS transporter n=1 Tax=Terrirubrum flagellatum TaxID=2895980 RepID=UPI0031455051